MRQTKIVATIGPSSDGPRSLPKLLDAGVNVVRLNFSHGDYEEMTRIVRIVRAYSKRTGRTVGILQDLQGPKVRVGKMADGVTLRDRSTVTLTAANVTGDATTIPLQYKGLPNDVKAGDTILLDDGLIELRVLSRTTRTISAKVVHGGPLISHKGINVPSASLSLPALTAKDRRDLDFGLAAGVDMVALSFVKTAADIKNLRRRITKAGSTAKIIAKIEKHEAVHNLSAILDEADGVMVARGDLGVELPPQEVPLIQKRIIHLANNRYKPVITATQMLESMIVHPRPTRAEVSDIANAILDGTDAVMLSAETATGNYPVEAVKIMARTAVDVERFFTTQPLRGRHVTSDSVTTEAVSIAACELARDTNARLIVVPTHTGSSARAVARHRVRKPVVALTENPGTAAFLALSWGVQPFVVRRYRSVDQMVVLARRFVLGHKLAKRHERFVITAGWPFHQPGKTNMIQLHRL